MGCSCQAVYLLLSISDLFFHLIFLSRNETYYFCCLTWLLPCCQSSLSPCVDLLLVIGSQVGSRQPVEGVFKCINFQNWNKCLYITLTSWDCVWEEMRETEDRFEPGWEQRIDVNLWHTSYLPCVAAIRETCCWNVESDVLAGMNRPGQM